MAFTGDLEHLPIVDIIQLVHTTRKSGIFSVKGSRGESRIVFSNGYIVSANHLNSSVRIGTVLVKTGAVTIDELRQAFGIMKAAGGNRRPLMATLMQMGSLKREDALRGLKKLVEIAIVELMSWTTGTFTFDADAMVFSSESGASADDPDQDLLLDAQMVLMDALRICDERERDRAMGKELPPDEHLFADLLPEERIGAADGNNAIITADDLGLADIDLLEKKIPAPVSEMEVFDPVEIHRQKIKELLADFPSADQESFVAFLKHYADRRPASGAVLQQAGKAVVMFSGDQLVRHSVMTICGEDGAAVFATDDEAELERIIAQCIIARRAPVIVFESPDNADGFSEEKAAALRGRVKGAYPSLPLLQFAPPDEVGFILGSYRDGVLAVLPKPRRTARETYVQDMIAFLRALKTCVNGFHGKADDADGHLKQLKDRIRSLRGITVPSDAALAVLTVVSETFERAAVLVVRSSELVGERAIGIGADKQAGPVPAEGLKLAPAKSSIFRDVIATGRAYYGESTDETLTELFKQIGEPLRPAVLLLPLLKEGKVVALVYGDFGRSKASPAPLDMLEVLAEQASLVLEYAAFRRHVMKKPQ